MAGAYYSILIDYKLRDGGTSASAGLKNIGKSASSAANSLGMLKGMLLGIVGGFGVRKMFDGLVGYNSKMEQLKITMGGILSLNMGKPFEKAQVQADRLVMKMQTLASKSPGTTEDYARFGANIAAQVGQAGGSNNDLMALIHGGVGASMMYYGSGVGDQEKGALDVQQMLNGQVTLRDRMARSLLASEGYTDFNKFNRLARKDPTKALGVVEKIFTNPKLLASIERLSHSTLGEWSTIRDRGQIVMGRAGQGLTNEITKDMRRINKWFEDNPKEVASGIKWVSDGLITIYNGLKDAGSFIIQNKTTFLEIGKLFLAFKGGQLITGVGFALVQFGSQVTSVTGLMSLLAAGIIGVIYEMRQQELKQKNFKDTNAVLADPSLTNEEKKNVLQDRGWVTFGGGINNAKIANDAVIGSNSGWSFTDLLNLRGPQAFVAEQIASLGPEHGRKLVNDNPMLASISANLPSFGKEIAQVWSTQQNVGVVMNKAADEMSKSAWMYSDSALLLANLFAEKNPFVQLAMTALGWGKTPFVMQDSQDMVDDNERSAAANKGIKPSMNVTINKIEVSDTNPDRFVEGMISAFEDIAQNPAAAGSITRNMRLG